MQELPIINPISSEEIRIKKPNWLRVKLPIGEEYKHVRNLVDTHKLHTICESGNCPNMGECWGAGTATFMI
jgi:lipoic acid synthetase